MKIFVAGCTGGTGRAFVNLALVAGHRVTAVARDPRALGPLAGDVDAVACDVRDAGRVGDLVAGHDAVVSLLGIGMRRHVTDVYSAGCGNLLAGLRAHGVTRFLCLSSSALDVRDGAGLAERVLIGGLLHRVLAAPYGDMREMERQVAAAPADWTIVRAARLTGGGLTGMYRVRSGAALESAWSISRTDCAHALLSLVDDAAAVRRVVHVAY